MSRFLVCAFLALSAVARADVSVKAGADGKPPACNYQQARYWRDAASEVVKRLRPPGEVGLMELGARHALFSDGWYLAKKARSVVLDRASGKTLLDIPTESSALVEDSSGELVGLVAVDSTRHELRLLDGKTGAVRWRLPIKNLSGDSASVALDGGSLVVTTFHRIATGSELRRIDLATGRVEWIADVVQLNVPHSKYFNDVEVSLAAGVVTLRGTEAGGCYLQTFDATTGRRLSSTIFGR